MMLSNCLKNKAQERYVLSECVTTALESLKPCWKMNAMNTKASTDKNISVEGEAKRARLAALNLKIPSETFVFAPSIL